MDKIERKVLFEQWSITPYVRDYYFAIAHNAQKFPEWAIEGRDKSCRETIKNLWKTPPDKRYGISIEDVICICAENNFACGSCGIPFELVGWNIEVDHDHELEVGDEKYVRGVICSQCNRKLYTKQNIEMIKSGRALDYILGEGDNFTEDVVFKLSQFEMNINMGFKLDIPNFEEWINDTSMGYTQNGHDLDRKYYGYINIV